MSHVRKVGRSAVTGQFITVSKARQQSSTSIVQHIKFPGKRK
jgi:hypothetical protein